MTEKKPSIRPSLDSLHRISEKTRAEIGEATAKFLQSYGIDHTKPDQSREMFLAALDGMADLMQYGELGPAAISNLHRARVPTRPARAQKHCLAAGAPIRLPRRRGRGARVVSSVRSREQYAC